MLACLPAGLGAPGDPCRGAVKWSLGQWTPQAEPRGHSSHLRLASSILFSPQFCCSLFSLFVFSLHSLFLLFIYHNYCLLHCCSHLVTPRLEVITSRQKRIQIVNSKFRLSPMTEHIWRVWNNKTSSTETVTKKRRKSPRVNGGNRRLHDRLHDKWSSWLPAANDDTLLLFEAKFSVRSYWESSC